MNFTDFKPEDLIGKTVLYNDGFGRKRLTTIDRITKTCFGIKHNEVLFKLRNGSERGRTGWHTANCILLTEEEANNIRQEFQIKKRIELAKNAIQHELNSGRPTLEQLEAAAKALGLIELK